MRACWAYIRELNDAIDLADLPWGYTASVYWRSGRKAEDPRLQQSARKRHQHIEHVVCQLSEGLGKNHQDDYVRLVFRDDVADLDADIELSHITRWERPEESPGRLIVTSWGHWPWNVEANAARVAEKLARKRRKGQAQSRQAGTRVLVVDCSCLKSYWDLALSPDDRTIGAYCDAVESQLDCILVDLDGVVLWAPYVPLGEPKRLIAASTGLPQTLLAALSGCPWPASGSRLARCRSRPA